MHHQSAGAKPLKEQDSRTSNEVNGNQEGTQSMHVALGQSSDQIGGQVSNQESNEQTELMCRFNFPKPLASATHFEINEKRKPVLVTRRNDSRINGHNPAQLTGWRTNVDMQVCTNAEMVTKYTCKYASKSAGLSEPLKLKKTFKVIVDDLRDDEHPKKAEQKLLLKSVAEHDYSAQEACHLLLGKKLVICSKSFVIVGLDGQREVDLETSQQQTSNTFKCVRSLHETASE